MITEDDYHDGKLIKLLSEDQLKAIFKTYKKKIIALEKERDKWKEFAEPYYTTMLSK